MHGDVVGLVAFYFILRLILARVVGVPFVIYVLDMNLDYAATDMPGFGIPGDVIADFKPFGHLLVAFDALLILRSPL